VLSAVVAAGSIMGTYWSSIIDLFVKFKNHESKRRKEDRR